MNNPPSPDAGTNEGPRQRYRRFPWLTREDVAVLNALTPNAAREYERLLHQQANLARHIARREVTESDLKVGAGPTSVEDLHGIIAARYQYGCGGGHQQPQHPTDQQDPDPDN